METPKKQNDTTVGSVFDLPAKSLNLVRKNWKMFALVNIFMIISSVFSLTDSNHYDENGSYAFNGLFFDILSPDKELSAQALLGLVMIIIMSLTSIFLYAMMTSLHLRASKGEQPNVNVLFDTASKLWIRQIALFIVMGFIIIIGLILLIVPGVIAIIRLSLAPYFMFDKNLSVVDSIKASNNLAKQHTKAVASAVLLIILITIISGAVSFIPYVGPLLDAFIGIAYSLIIVLRYRELTNLKQDQISPVQAA